MPKTTLYNFKFVVTNMRSFEEITLNKRCHTIGRARDLSKDSARKVWGQGVPIAIRDARSARV